MSVFDHFVGLALKGLRYLVLTVAYLLKVCSMKFELNCLNRFNEVTGFRYQSKVSIAEFFMVRISCYARLQG